MSDYDFDVWLPSQANLDIETIKSNALTSAADAELRLKGLRPAVEGINDEQLEIFVRRVKTLFTILNSGERDTRTTDEDWQAFKPICEALAAKNQLDKAIVDKFQN